MAHRRLTASDSMAKYFSMRAGIGTAAPLLLGMPTKHIPAFGLLSQLHSPFTFAS